MVYNATYNDDEVTNSINEAVGIPFNWLKRLKLGGVGSKRMIINAFSPKLNHIKNNNQDLNYGNIELRPKGVIVHITKGLERFAWPIPYYKLVIYKTEGLSIHANGSFIKFKSNKTYKENKGFINKLLDQKLYAQNNFNSIS